MSFITDEDLDPLDEDSLTICLPDIVDGGVVKGILDVLHRRGFGVTLQVGPGRDDVPVINLHCERRGASAQH